MKKKSPLIPVLTCALTLSVLGLGTLTALSLRSISSLKQDVAELKLTVSEIQDFSAALSERADQLANLLPSVTPAADEEASSEEDIDPEHAAEHAEGPEPAPSEEQGTLSPPSGESSLLTSNDPAADEQLAILMNQLQGQLPTGNGSWSVYVSSLKSGSEASINNAPMQAASLIKLFIMGAVYENYDSLSNTYGANTLYNLLYSMITVSDNDSANTLTRYLGGGDDTTGRYVVNQFCQAHGYTSTTMGRMLLAPADNGDNITSAEDCGRFLKEIYDSVTSGTVTGTLSHTEEMYSLLKDQQRRHKIPANLPAGVGTANKTGELSNVENDAAIIYNTAKGEDLVIVFMSQYLTEPGSAQYSISTLSREIYGFFNE